MTKNAPACSAWRLLTGEFGDDLRHKGEGPMFELGPEKLLVLLMICLVLFGGKRIPEIGGSIGKGIREFKRGMSDIDESIRAPSREGQGNSVAPDEVREPKRLS
jgi:sec-independent protein translocase protein TatA